MKKYKYNINNLDCAHCAKKIEEELNKDERLNNVIVNFSSLKISYETEENISLKELNSIINKIESGVSVTLEVSDSNTKEYHFVVLLIGFLFGLIGVFCSNYVIGEVLTLLSYIVLLYKPFKSAFLMLVKNKAINENLLIVISCVGAYIIGENFEGIMVVSLYLLGKILEEKAINNTRHSVRTLIDLKENFAFKKVDDKVIKVDVESLMEKDVIIVKKGSRIPVDGVVLKGSSFIDYSMLTGEVAPVNVGVNDEVLSGTINKGEVIEVKVTKRYEDSTVCRILSLIEDATDKKANIETSVSKLSKIYTPLVLLLAILVAAFLPLVSNVNYDESVYRALTFLVISCPCAIAISVPLSYFTGIGVSSKKGILIKGSNYLDNLSKISKIIFDKTGTLTNGSFNISNIEIIDERYSKEELIDMLIKGEMNSTHPIAEAIINLKKSSLDNNDVKNYKEISGKGISYSILDDKIKVGNSKICNCEYDANLHVNINGSHVASITLDDGIKRDAVSVIDDLKKENIEIYMFTGDKKKNALDLGKKLSIDKIEYEMLPTDKYGRYEEIKKNDEIVAFVGDGINDAPTLKRADIGVSMGNLGTEAAIEASDIVIINDDLEKIPLMVKISKYTNKIIKENLIFAIGVKVTILLLSVLGSLSMWFAVFADTGVTLITILNTLRIMYRFKK